MKKNEKLHTKSHPKHKNFRMLKFLKVTLIYFLLFVALSSMVDYYAMMEFNFLWFIVISLILGVGFGYYHVMYGKRDHVDDMANDFL